MSITVLACDAVPEIPKEIAVCPICGDKLVLEIDAWEQEADGSWSAAEDGTHVDCVSEPDIESDEWDGWFNGHYSMPYVDWMPVEMRVYKWLYKHYRFEERK